MSNSKFIFKNARDPLEGRLKALNSCQMRHRVFLWMGQGLVDHEMFFYEKLQLFIAALFITRQN